MKLPAELVLCLVIQCSQLLATNQFYSIDMFIYLLDRSALAIQ